jgi:hypothetical protein
VGGLELGLAGHASADQSEKIESHFEIDTHLKREIDIDSHRYDGLTAIVLFESEVDSILETKSELKFEIDTHLKREINIDTHRNDGLTAIALSESEVDSILETKVEVNLEIDTHLESNLRERQLRRLVRRLKWEIGSHLKIYKIRQIKNLYYLMRN